MKTLSAWVVVLLIFGPIVTDGNLFDLQKMIKQVTGKSTIPNYIAYGCYCGQGGRGEPLDATDRCCRDHDCCYRRVMRQRCKPKRERYSYTHLSGNVKCGGGTQCQQQICECDRDFVLCLKKTLGELQKILSLLFEFLVPCDHIVTTLQRPLEESREYFKGFYVNCHPVLALFLPHLIFLPGPYWRDMKILLGVTMLLASSVLLAQGSLLEFGKMILIATGKSAFPEYTAYGCYCGLGGKGQPQDATDSCCLVHDCCYRALKGKCEPKFDIYRFSYHERNITCEEGTWCEMEICECDKAAALCFQDNLDSYNKTLRFYSNIHCNGTMQC
ncbi:uncharacterized protein LOC132587346 [Heteronotia binoei]|uniref:uncharacterized protein LOC132587346 n=1 Tax=Heteronotia binoei TaxID=13085 RepID=UPI00292E4442|nr:uncharacterized protein LOC132587346 [Heteronotia binoei]